MLVDLLLLLWVAVANINAQSPGYQWSVINVTSPESLRTELNNIVAQDQAGASAYTLPWNGALSGNFHPLFPDNLDGNGATWRLSVPYAGKDQACCPAPYDADCVSTVGHASTIRDSVVLIRRGDCFFFDKFMTAQKLGASGVLIINNVPGKPVMGMTKPDGTGPFVVQIPGALISMELGDWLISHVRENTRVDISAQRYVPMLPNPANRTPGQYRESFIVGVEGRQTPQCTSWLQFLDGLNSTTNAYNHITLFGQWDENGVVCRKPDVVEGLRNALKMGSAYSAACDGRKWTVDNCLGLPEITVLPHGSACTCSMYFASWTLRPCAHSAAWPTGMASAGWGGMATSTCQPPDQWMSASFGALADVMEVFHEYFHENETPYRWSVWDVDGDGYNWFFNRLGAVSESLHVPAGAGPHLPLRPDNWLVTPPLLLGTDKHRSHPTNVSFVYEVFHAQWLKEHLELYINWVGPHPDNFVSPSGLLLHSWVGSTLDPETVEVDLTSHVDADRPAWLAWRHRNPAGQDPQYAVGLYKVQVNNAMEVPGGWTTTPTLVPASSSPRPIPGSSPGPNPGPAPSPSPTSDLSPTQPKPSPFASPNASPTASPGPVGVPSPKPDASATPKPGPGSGLGCLLPHHVYTDAQLSGTISPATKVVDPCHADHPPRPGTVVLWHAGPLSHRLNISTASPSLLSVAVLGMDCTVLQCQDSGEVRHQLPYGAVKDTLYLVLSDPLNEQLAFDIVPSVYVYTQGYWQVSKVEFEALEGDSVQQSIAAIAGVEVGAVTVAVISEGVQPSAQHFAAQAVSIVVAIEISMQSIPQKLNLRDLNAELYHQSLPVASRLDPPVLRNLPPSSSPPGGAPPSGAPDDSSDASDSSILWPVFIMVLLMITVVLAGGSYAYGFHRGVRLTIQGWVDARPAVHSGEEVYEMGDVVKTVEEFDFPEPTKEKGQSSGTQVCSLNLSVPTKTGKIGWATPTPATLNPVDTAGVLIDFPCDPGLDARL